VTEAMDLSTAESGLRAAMLRRDFDAAFAAPHASLFRETEELLAVRVGPDLYAMRVAELAGLHADRKITPLPNQTREQLGIVAVRGVLAPVLDLRSLLGYPSGPAPRWLVFTRGAEPVGLAFDRFESHLRVTRVQGLPLFRAGEHARPHVLGAVPLPTGPLPLIQIDSILAAVVRPKER